MVRVQGGKPGSVAPTIPGDWALGEGGWGEEPRGTKEPPGTGNEEVHWVLPQGGPGGPHLRAESVQG